MLVRLRRFIMGDETGERSIRATGLGKYVAGDLIVELISTILTTEHQCDKAIEDLKTARQENKAWVELMGGYYLEDLDVSRRSEIAALVDKWETEDAAKEE